MTIHTVSLSEIRTNGELRSAIKALGWTAFLELCEPLVRRRVFRLQFPYGMTDGLIGPEDMVNAGLQIVWENVEAWDPDRQDLERYLQWIVGVRLIDEFRKCGRISRGAAQFLGQVQEAREQLERAGSGAAVTDEALATALGMSVSEMVRHIADCSPVVVHVGHENSARGLDNADSGNTAASLSWDILSLTDRGIKPERLVAAADWIGSALRRMSTNYYRLAWAGYMLFGLTMKESASMAGVSESRISQLMPELTARAFRIEADESRGYSPVALQPLLVGMWDSLLPPMQEQLIVRFRLFGSGEPIALDSDVRVRIPRLSSLRLAVLRRTRNGVHLELEPTVLPGEPIVLTVATEDSRIIPTVPVELLSVTAD